MLERGKNERGVIEIISMEELIPPEHLLRKVDKTVEFGKLYEIVEFRWILDEAGTAGALSPAAVFIDGTHIKANIHKKIKQEVPAAAKRYREAHGKKPFDDDNSPKESKRRDNTSRKKLARRKKAAQQEKLTTEFSLLPIIAIPIVPTSGEATRTETG